MLARFALVAFATALVAWTVTVQNAALKMAARFLSVLP